MEDQEGGHEPALISAEELLYASLPMPTGPVQDPAVFVESLRRYHEAGKAEQGALANALSGANISAAYYIIDGKRFDRMGRRG